MKVRSSSAYDAFSLRAVATADAADTFDPVGFGGQQGYYHDYAGLSLLTHRYYDAGAGRFVTRDPIGYTGGINLYGFAGNNPVNRMDPEGTQDAPTDSMAYIGNMFNNLTPHDWLHTLVHNDVTHALKMGVEIYGSFLGPEELGIEGAVEGAGVVATKVNCFVGGTMVQMADGSVKPIEQVSVNNWVISRDASTGKTEAKQISAVYHKQSSQVLTLALADRQTGQVIQTLTCTPGHPFYVVGQGFVLAGQLAIGNAIVTRAGPELLVKSIDWCHNGDGTPRGAEVYNFTVEGDHTYFVGAIGGGVWVHNDSITASAMHVLDLSNNAWRQTKFAQKGLVYVLKDSTTGEALKVGQTTAGKFVGRFEKYITAGRRNNRNLALEVFETPLAQRGQIEGALRRTFGRAPRLPWDNAGRPPRLGRPGPGVPR